MPAKCPERKRLREGGADEGTPDAPIQPIDRARVAYNRPCLNQPQLDEKGRDHTKAVVQAKTDAFCACFSATVRVRDLRSGKDILPDAKSFRARYQTVFRESGAALQMRVLARGVFDHPSGRRALVLDREQHESLVTPIGAMLDGSLGLRGPREQGLWALYEVDARASRVVSVWVCPAEAAAGTPGQAADVSACQDHLAELQASGLWAALAAVVRDRLGDGWRLRTDPLHSVCVGCFEMQGRRPTMEDKITVEELVAPQLSGPTGSPVCFIGVYDGHGGGACARFAADSVHRRLAHAEAFAEGQVAPALRDAFVRTDEEFLASENESGSCALVALVGGGRLFMAHVGDSRAVLCSGQQGEATRLTEDHKPDVQGERERIERVGGQVIFGGRCWRVTHRRTQMMLATSRSLGDAAFKQSWLRAATEARVREEMEREAEAAERERAEAVTGAEATGEAEAAEGEAATEEAEGSETQAEAVGGEAKEQAGAGAAGDGTDGMEMVVKSADAFSGGMTNGVTRAAGEATAATAVSADGTASTSGGPTGPQAPAPSGAIGQAICTVSAPAGASPPCAAAPSASSNCPPMLHLPCELSVRVPVPSPVVLSPPAQLPAGEMLPELLLAEPTISERWLRHDDRFLILACDGVWDVLTDQQACDCVAASLARPDGSAEAAAKKLVGDAYAAGSTDNISAVVAILRPFLV